MHEFSPFTEPVNQSFGLAQLTVDGLIVVRKGYVAMHRIPVSTCIQARASELRRQLITRSLLLIYGIVLYILISSVKQLFAFCMESCPTRRFWRRVAITDGAIYNKLRYI